MVFRTKRRKGRLATAPTLKRSSRQPGTAPATVQPKEEEVEVQVALPPSLNKVTESKYIPKSPKVQLNSPPARSAPTLVPDEDGVELSIDTSFQPIGPPEEAQGLVSKWGDRSPTEIDLSSKTSDVEGIERILESRSPKSIDQRVALASVETREADAPINGKGNLSDAKIMPLNIQPKRGFFRNSKSTTPLSRKRSRR